MMLRRRARTGSILIEAALVYPVVFLIVLGILILGVGVFRYQQVSHIARESARWASCHGAQYAQENGKPAATSQDVYTNAIVPQAAGMVLDNLSYAVTWNADNRPTRPVTVIDPANGLPKVTKVSNTVSVTVSYNWDTGIFGTISVSSTSVNPMSY